MQLLHYTLRQGMWGRRCTVGYFWILAEMSCKYVQLVFNWKPSVVTRTEKVQVLIFRWLFMLCLGGEWVGVWGGKETADVSGWICDVLSFWCACENAAELSLALSVMDDTFCTNSALLSVSGGRAEPNSWVEHSDWSRGATWGREEGSYCS